MNWKSKKSKYFFLRFLLEATGERFSLNRSVLKKLPLSGEIMGAGGYAADPLHGVGVLHHGEDGLKGLAEVLA